MSGKSTRPNLPRSIDAPDAGCVRPNRIDVSSLSARQRTAFRAPHIGLVFQNFNPVPVLTALENSHGSLLWQASAPQSFRHWTAGSNVWAFEGPRVSEFGSNPWRVYFTMHVARTF